jgi:diguanylate cyclase (GGDEF)-like protein
VNDLESVRVCSEIRGYLSLLRRSELEYVLASQAGNGLQLAKDMESTTFPKLEKTMREYVSGGLVISPQEQALYDDFKKKVEAYLAFREKTVALAKNGNGYEAYRREAESEKLVNLAFAALNEDIKYNKDRSAQKIKAVSHIYIAGVTATVVAITAASIMGALYVLSLGRREQMLLELSLTDAMTGISNRRGFMHLAQQQLESAERSHKQLALFFADLNGLKSINDTFGHAEGDRAITDTATILKKVFRSSDIIARLGGDEFVILSQMYSPEEDESVAQRLDTSFRDHNRKVQRPYSLSISFGSVIYRPGEQVLLEDLLAEGDRLMYDRKRTAKTLAPAGEAVPGQS